MSDFGVCPLCGHNCFSDNCLHATADYIAEIARLKAELTNGQELLGYALAEVDGLKAVIEQANTERDEARRLARKYYRLYLIEQKNYLNINDDENIWF